MAESETPDTGTRSAPEQRSNVSRHGAFATCDAQGPQSVIPGPDFKPLICERPLGHTGAHAMGETTWSTLTPLGPKPKPTSDFGPLLHTGAHAEESYQAWRQRNRQRNDERPPPAPPKLDLHAPLPEPLTVEAVAAELVKCGRAIGRVDVENVVRRRWQSVLQSAVRMLPPDAQTEPSEEQWASVGRFLYDFAKDEACTPQSHDETQAQQYAAGALGVLQGMCTPRAVSLLDAAGASLGLWRTAFGAAWRAAKQARTLGDSWPTRKVVEQGHRRCRVCRPVEQGHPRCRVCNPGRAGKP